MSKIKADLLHVKVIDVGIYTEDYRNEYISLTDIARFRNSDDPRFAIQNWMRNRNTLEFLGLWESLHNPNFNRVQFDTFRSEAGSASYASPQHLFALWLISLHARSRTSRRTPWHFSVFITN